jgi:hypothetical protein
MNMYLVVPAYRSFGPSKTFFDAALALAYARDAAQKMHLPYAVWHVEQGRLKLLQRFAATPRAA